MRTLALLALVGGAAADDAPLSEAETERLLREAAGWRSGQRNGTRSLRRAVEMYALAADRGSGAGARHGACLLYTSPSPRDGLLSRMPSSA